jgi:flavin-dependent dehydrogenase
MPDSLAVLARLGVTLDPADSYSFRGIRFISQEHSAEAFFPGEPGRGTRRTRLSQLLVARAQELGVQLHWETTVRGIDGDEVQTTNGTHSARWIIGADGHQSTIRKLAGMDARRVRSHRIGLRRHFRISPWTDMLEIYWGERSQAYITPVADDEICVAIIASKRPESFDLELQQFPQLVERLRAATPTDAVVGSATIDVSFNSVARGNVALIGDASGAVDALTGEGLALAFRQAMALATAMRDDDLQSYRRAHAEIARLPRFMSSSLLLLDRSRLLRQRTLRAFASQPAIFASMLGIHVGEQMPPLWGSNGIFNLGARVLLA